MSDKRKILIIENQYTQFLKIYDNLSSNDFKKYPCNGEIEFIAFIDHVRVWVNENYIEEQRTDALKYINYLINENDIELILMDHILGGAHHCKTGIDLAYALNESRLENNLVIPVLFISKTKLDDKKREVGASVYGTNLKGIKNYESKFSDSSYKWVHKGYMGDEILDSGYFTENVLNKITQLLGLSAEARFWNALDLLLSLPFPNNLNFMKIKLGIIKKSKNYQGIEKSLIENIISVSISKKIFDLNINE